MSCKISRGIALIFLDIRIAIIAVQHFQYLPSMTLASFFGDTTHNSFHCIANVESRHHRQRSDYIASRFISLVGDQIPAYLRYNFLFILKFSPPNVEKLAIGLFFPPFLFLRFFGIFSLCGGGVIGFGGDFAVRRYVAVEV